MLISDCMSDVCSSDLIDPAATAKPESYILDVKASGIAITAHDAAGASHALRSLAQQAAFEKGKLTPLHVENASEYGFRGLHIDLGRNFHGRDEILKLVEAMEIGRASCRERVCQSV